MLRALLHNCALSCCNLISTYCIHIRVIKQLLRVIQLLLSDPKRARTKDLLHEAPPRAQVICAQSVILDSYSKDIALRSHRSLQGCRSEGWVCLFFACFDPDPLRYS